jgi:hypothetical protein
LGIIFLPNAKGITKLGELFWQRGMNDYEGHLRFLRNLQELRSTGVAHRKSENYRRAAAAFGLMEKDLRDAFREFLAETVAFLSYLDANSDRIVSGNNAG